jgi:signal recognition particle subunit SEC65
MNILLEDYLDYLQDSNAPAGIFIALSLVYSAFKNWKSRQNISNTFCKKYKGDTIRTDICIAERQMKNAKTIIKQLQGARHTCEDGRYPGRCREKVRYYIQKYQDKIIDLNKRLTKKKIKLVKRQYKEKLRHIKKK